MHDVFISYSHKDKNVADAICARFESENIRCWYAPRDIAPGADWAASIVDAIKGAKVMVLIFTDFSNASNQVLREVNNAVGAGIPIVPFKLTETLPSKGMQYYLSTGHWLDAMTRPLENSIYELDLLVRAILLGQAPSSTEQRFRDAAPKGVKKKRLVPIVLTAAVFLIVAGVAVFLLIRGAGQPQSRENDASSETEAATSAHTLAIEESDELEVFTPPGDNKISLDYSNTGTQGNLQCNYQNKGYAATDGEWFFFRGDKGYLYRMKLDGSEKSQLDNKSVYYIGVVDGKIYYFFDRDSLSGVMRMNIDGSDRKTIYSGRVEQMRIKDNRIYFNNGLDSLKLYSMNMEGEDVRKENDLALGDTYNADYVLWEDRIYWINEKDGNTVYSAKLDGSDEQKLTDKETQSMTVVDGWLLYSDTTIRMMNLKTKEVNDTRSTKASELLVCDYGIFAKSNRDWQRLYRMPVGANSGGLVCQEKMYHISTAAGYVFYEGLKDDGLSDGNMYLVDYKGEKVVKL